MRLTVGLISTLAGYAAASQNSAEVYILPCSDALSLPSPPPVIAPSLARLLFLQRLASNGQGFFQHDIPNGVSTENTISFLNRFGKPTPELFSKVQTNQPSQLVLILDGIEGSHTKEFRRLLGVSPSFTIADPPVGRAHKDLIELDLLQVSAVADGNKCSIRQIVNPMEDCWSGKSSAVAKYSIKENFEILKKVAKHMQQLIQLAKSGDLETTIIVLPSSKASQKGSNNWADERQELRRRQAEQVMSAFDRPEVHPQTTPSSTPESLFLAPTGRIASCYDTFTACSEATRNCTGHGVCKDKYASEDGVNTAGSCFACHCQATRDRNNSLTHWGGASCAKEDISAPFWLLAGFTMAMVGILSMSISLLYSVGEEKLPGVIGAGVSRSS